MKPALVLNGLLDILESDDLERRRVATRKMILGLALWPLKPQACAIHSPKYQPCGQCKAFCHNTRHYECFFVDLAYTVSMKESPNDHIKAIRDNNWIYYDDEASRALNAILDYYFYRLNHYRPRYDFALFSFYVKYLENFINTPNMSNYSRINNLMKAPVYSALKFFGLTTSYMRPLVAQIRLSIPEFNKIRNLACELRWARTLSEKYIQAVKLHSYIISSTSSNIPILDIPELTNMVECLNTIQKRKNTKQNFLKQIQSET